MIVIVDYGMGNLRSVQKAAEFLDKRALITDSKDAIKTAKKIILPGVAHFGKTVKELRKRGLFELLKEKIKQGVLFFGVCVGMQVLFEESEEAPGIKGLGIIKGRVKRFRGKDLIIPHMGWNQIRVKGRGSRVKGQGSRGKEEDLFEGVGDGSYFYFANSYYCAPKDKSVITSTTEYGVEFASAIRKDNVWGVQFHPEKSQKLGLRVLNNFLGQG